MPKYKKELSKEHLRPYEKAPIYKSCRFLNMNARHIRKEMPRADKYEDGHELLMVCRNLRRAAALAYIEKQETLQQLIRKRALIKNLERKTMEAWLFHRDLHDDGLISNNMFIEQSEHFDNIEKQTAGWLNFISEEIQKKRDAQKVVTGQNSDSPQVVAGEPSSRIVPPNEAEARKGSFQARKRP